MKLRTAALAAALLATLPLAGCSNAPNPPSPPATPGAPSAPQTALGRTVEKAMGEARRKLQTENIKLNGKDGSWHVGKHAVGGHDPNLPEAEITPQGDLMVAGQAVPLDAAQRRLVMDYRARLLDIATTGMALGTQGADLGMRAAGEAMKGIFTGNGDEVGKKIEAEAEKLKAQAKTFCTQLQPMLAAQNALAASVPQFKPYASLEQADIDECMKEDGASFTTGNGGDSAANGATVDAAVRDEIRRTVREEVRNAVQEATGKR